MNSMTKRLDKDNCEAILSQAKDLIGFVEQAYHQGEAIHEVERGIFKQLLRMVMIYWSYCWVCMAMEIKESA